MLHSFVNGVHICTYKYMYSLSVVKSQHIKQCDVMFIFIFCIEVMFYLFTLYKADKYNPEAF